MISEKIQEALNEQINAELYSSYIYYSMSAYFDSISLSGFAHWMRVQALEELTHVQKLSAFINDRGGRAMMKPIPGPETEWASPLAVFKAAYAHEVEVSRLVNKLVDMSLAESDHGTYNFLQWFVSEQVEEEATADGIVQKLKLVEGAPGGLFLLDREVALRVFALPPDVII